MDAPQNPDFSICPLCGQGNSCAVAAQDSGTATASLCWCMTESFPEDLQSRLQQQPGPARCICSQCLRSHQEKQHEQ